MATRSNRNRVNAPAAWAVEDSAEWFLRFVLFAAVVAAVVGGVAALNGGL